MRRMDCNIQRGGGAMKEVLNAKKSVDWRTIPEYTNESLVNANPYCADNLRFGFRGAANTARF